jgi:hypothetical protein
MKPTSSQLTLEVVPRFSRMRSGTVVVAGIIWLAVVTVGLALMARYENSPGTVRAVPESFPATGVLQREPGMFSLVMLLHPRCPCSRATIGELEKVMARCGGRVHALVLCFKPEGAADDWAQTDLWRSAAAIPGVKVRVDEGGREAACFGAETSGQALLFDTKGRLLFHGGITAGRGHAGDNAGSEAVLALVNGAAVRETTAVFGCPIQDRCDLQTAGREQKQ